MPPNNHSSINLDSLLRIQVITRLLAKEGNFIRVSKIDLSVIDRFITQYKDGEIDEKTLRENINEIARIDNDDEPE